MWLAFFRKSSPASARRKSRPAVEPLEERFLLTGDLAMNVGPSDPVNDSAYKVKVLIKTWYVLRDVGSYLFYVGNPPNGGGSGPGTGGGPGAGSPPPSGEQPSKPLVDPVVAQPDFTRVGPEAAATSDGKKPQPTDASLAPDLAAALLAGVLVDSRVPEPEMNKPQTAAVYFEHAADLLLSSDVVKLWGQRDLASSSDVFGDAPEWMDTR